ncbi:MAG: CpaF family protein, partial [Acidobacteria bacterium]|nr:CpaF family protein [Acidobacteriota bacterium]
MSVLRERLLEQQNGSAARVTGNLRASNELQELKARVHRTLINKLDLTKLENADPAVVQNDVKKVIERILDDENAPMSGLEREQVQTDVLNELFGLGPLEPLLADKTISDILVNGWRSVY